MLHKSLNKVNMEHRPQYSFTLERIGKVLQPLKIWAEALS